MTSKELNLYDTSLDIKYNYEKRRFEWHFAPKEGEPWVNVNFSVKQYLEMIKDFSSHIIKLVEDGTITLPEMMIDRGKK